MTNAQTKRELLGLERSYWQALKDQDVEAAVALTDHTCIVTGPQGVTRLTRDNLASMMKSANYKLNRFELGDDAEIELLGDDVAVLAYKVHEDLTVDGKPVKLDAADSSTWVRRDGEWLCALHTEALAGDPFGRDRGKRTA